METNYWFGAVRALLKPEDNIVVVEIDPINHVGWAALTIIEYFQRDHDSRPGI